MCWTTGCRHDERARLLAVFPLLCMPVTSRILNHAAPMIGNDLFQEDMFFQYCKNAILIHFSSNLTSLETCDFVATPKDS